MVKGALDELEPNDKVPEYLKKALISELDVIRDTVQIVSQFMDGFFKVALMSIPNSSDSNATLND
jgi:hypothetical protein